jgi:predicted phage terminase large subunit-like protein
MIKMQEKNEKMIKYFEYFNFLQKKFQNRHRQISLKDFIIKVFEELNPGQKFIDNWHIDLIAQNLEASFYGKKKRILISMPPRYMKSLCVSIAFPAWVLGIDPSKKIICVSYSQIIANKFSCDTRKILNTNWYQKLFPGTRILKGENLKSRFSTGKNGFRFASSVGGSLTGEGADIIIVDDPHKPSEIFAAKQRDKVIEWYETTLLSRLNDKRNGSIIIVMQRLHKADLIGRLLAKTNSQTEWENIKFDAIAKTQQEIKINPNTAFIRKQGEALHPSREDVSDLARIKSDIGEYAFEAQYQQNPVASDGTLINKKWLEYYEEKNINTSKTYFLSLDTAMKTGELNDYTAISVWFVLENEPNKTYLEEIINERLNYPNLLDKAIEISKKYKPINILIEDKASGTSLIQDLRKRGIINITPQRPYAGKIIRFAAACVYFRESLVYFNTDMQNRLELEEQILSFPNAEHDDMCDSVSMFLNWYHSLQRTSKRTNPVRLRELT